MPHAILFDLFGPLVDTTKSDQEGLALLRQVVAKAGVRVSDSALSAAESFAVESFAPNLFESVIFKLVNRDSTLALRCISEFRRQFRPKLEPRPGADKLLKACKARFWQVALVNRLVPDDREALDKAGILRYVDFVGPPAAMKVELPDTRVFEFMLGNLGLPPTDCVMCGARLDNDIRPANELRMTTVLLRVGKHGPRQLPRDLKDVPGFTADTLDDLERVLAGLQ